ncbi:MAG: peptide chain release factor N(5)-glutamine methyltransferase, partial [Planctomycetota bacterium]|nr:peptide chain release factor N(5)-glutamine methyltransferase [Planctomycetota bacterium]
MSSEQTDWTSKKLLNWMRERFEASGVDASRVVAETLLAESFDCSRLEIHKHPHRPASREELDPLRDQVRRILSRE